MSRFDEQPDGDPHGECAAEIDKLKALNAELAAALSGMVEITELTIGWLPTPPNADGPLIVARAALAKHNRETQ